MKHSDHIILAIPANSLQGVRVGDLDTDLLQLLKEKWIDAFGPFCPGSGREKDAKAVLAELEDRYRNASLTAIPETKP